MKENRGDTKIWKTLFNIDIWQQVTSKKDKVTIKRPSNFHFTLIKVIKFYIGE